MLSAIPEPTNLLLEPLVDGCSIYWHEALTSRHVQEICMYCMDRHEVVLCGAHPFGGPAGRERIFCRRRCVVQFSNHLLRNSWKSISEEDITISVESFDGKGLRPEVRESVRNPLQEFCRLRWDPRGIKTFKKILIPPRSFKGRKPILPIAVDLKNRSSAFFFLFPQPLANWNHIAEFQTFGKIQCGRGTQEKKSYSECRIWKIIGKT